MISRRVLHLEAHWGYWPRISFRRVPQSGDTVWNGDVLCTLERCDHCGEGFLAREVEPLVDRHRVGPKSVAFDAPPP